VIHPLLESSASRAHECHIPYIVLHLLRSNALTLISIVPTDSNAEMAIFLWGEPDVFSIIIIAQGALHQN